MVAAGVTAASAVGTQEGGVARYGQHTNTPAVDDIGSLSVLYNIVHCRPIILYNVYCIIILGYTYPSSNR